MRLSPPDRHGFCTLSTSVDSALAAAQSARIILAEINHNVPRTHARISIHISDVTAFCITDSLLHHSEPKAPDEVDSCFVSGSQRLYDFVDDNHRPALDRGRR
ncbi:MAG: acyl-CoA hydrolase [Bradymonadia bacterium]|jgi:acyl-CoA hydrolase